METRPLTCIINSFVDFNWLASLIQRAHTDQGWEVEVWFLAEDMRKPAVKRDFAEQLETMQSFLFMQGVPRRVFTNFKACAALFRSRRGVIASTTPTFFAILEREGKQKGQQWIGFSFFGEDNEVAVLTEKTFTGSRADLLTVPPAKAALPLPYYDVFNPAIYPLLSNFRLPDFRREYRDVVTIPYITDAKATWFQESEHYVRQRMSRERLFIFKYRKKDQALAERMKHYQAVFAQYPNVLFFDSPFFDLTAELMRVSTRVFFTRKLSQFIKECFFSHARVEVLHMDEKSTFYERMIGLPAYDTIFDDWAADKESARAWHLYTSPHQAAEVLRTISKLPPPALATRVHTRLSHVLPWTLHQKLLKTQYDH